MIDIKIEKIPAASGETKGPALRWFSASLDERTPRKLHRTTLSEIAQHAGVSVSTVSLVLSNKAKERRISTRVINHVEKVASQLDYSPNLLVQSLQLGRTRVLSFFNAFRTRGKNDLYMDRLFTDIQLASGDLGYAVLIHCDFRQSDEEIYQSLNGGRADGLLFFAPDPSDKLLISLRTSRLPIVLINSEDVDGKLSSVKDDHCAGTKLVADKLIELGHTRIAAFGNIPNANKDANERIADLRRNLLHHGVAIPEEWIISTRGPNHSEAESGLKYLMAQPNPPTALFCWHDRLGYHVLDLCDKLGISVPEQLSIVGYDGIHWPALTRHTLTSVNVDLPAVATAAVTLLDDLIQGRQTGQVQRVIPVQLTLGTTLVAAGN